MKKHRENEKIRIVRVLEPAKEKSRMAQTLNEPSAPVTEEKTEHLKRTLFRQIDIVDELLANGISAPSTGVVLQKIHQQKQSGKAPYHERRTKIEMDDNSSKDRKYNF